MMTVRFIYFGGAHPTNARVIKLKRNMIQVDGPAIKVNTPGFFEASYVHKYNNKYYYSYSGHYFRKPTGIEYLVSDNPLTGFDNIGLIMPNPPVNDGFNHHHSIFLFKGNWYIAYHNRQLALNNGIEDIAAREFMRNVCIDQLYYNEDGTIQEVVPTKNGLKQLKYIDPFVWNEAETMAFSNGGINTNTHDYERHVYDIENGSWILVKGVDFNDRKVKMFEATVASNTLGGFLEVRLGSPSGKMISRLAFGNTGGWDKWKAVSAEAVDISGIQDIYLVFHGDRGELFAFDKWRFGAEK